MMCEPKEGGLGLRKIEMMNKAFIMKLAWGILQKNSLWMHFLKHKYISSNRGNG